MSKEPEKSESNSEVLMPSEAPDKDSHIDDSVVGVVVDHIKDDIEDGKTLRAWRPWVAIGLLVLAVVFYIAFFRFICEILHNPDLAVPVRKAGYLYVVIAILLAVIPTLFVTQVAKAVLGKKTGSSEVPYTPLQAILHLMREMKNQN